MKSENPIEQGSDPLEDYRQVENNARQRFAEVATIYRDNVPQADWLRLSSNSSVLMVEEEFSALPSAVQDFFSDGNISHYRDDRAALRGDNIILMDGYYSGGVSGDQRAQYFLDIATKFSAAPELLPTLSSENKEQWKAKLAIWDNLASLAAAGFHSLKAISLLETDLHLDLDTVESILSLMFEGYFLTLLGQNTDDLAERAKEAIEYLHTSVSDNIDTFQAYGKFDLFRTDREVMGAPALASAYSWAINGKLSSSDIAIGPLLGGIDELEAVKFLTRHQDELNLEGISLPSEFIYVLPKVTPIGSSSRSMGERSGVAPLYAQQEEMLRNIPIGSKLVIVDDTTSTMSSFTELETFLDVACKPSEVKKLACSVGTRWAVNDVASPEELEGVSATSISHTIRTFRGKHHGVETLEQRYQSRKMLDANRSFGNPEEIFNFIEQASDEGRANGVGFDLFGTLIEAENFDRLARRKELQAACFRLIMHWNPNLDKEQLLEIYKSARRKLEKMASDQNGEHAEFRDDEFWLEVLSLAGVESTNPKICKLLNIEFKMEQRTQKPIPGMVEVVKLAVEKFGQEHVGVFSNTRMPRELIVKLLTEMGYIGEGLLSEQQIYVSSDLGVQKPDPQTLKFLADALEIPARELIFIGDSDADVLAAGRTKAIGVRLHRD